MLNIKIAGMGSYLPDNIVTNDDLAKIVDTSDEWIKSRTGISERRISKGEGTTYMSVMAAKEAIAKAGVSSETIDLIIVSTITQDHFCPSTACQVQEAIGADKAMCFDLSAACSGFVFGLSTAAQYIKTGMCKTALVIGAELLSKLTNWEDRSTCVLLGDGAGAAIIQATEEKGYFDFLCRCDGSKGKYLLCESRPLKNIFVNKDSEHPYIEMDGREIYKFACSVVPEAIEKAVEKCRLKIEDIKYFVLHHANERIIKSVAKRLNVPLQKCYMNIQSYGNTSSASIPIALTEMFNKGLLKKGDTIVIAGFGGGLTYGAGVITI